MGAIRSDLDRIDGEIIWENCFLRFGQVIAYRYEKKSIADLVVPFGYNHLMGKLEE